MPVSRSPWRDCTNAGSHYDIGRQRFIFFRDVPGIEGKLHRLLADTNLLGINIMYTVNLANAPLQWLIERVQATQPHLLPASVEFYLRYANNKWPLLWYFPLCRPLLIDAYDSLIQRVGTLLPLEQVPDFSSAIKGFVSSQVLLDRHIPQAPEQRVKFYDMHPGGADPEQAFIIYISRAFQNFKLVNFCDYEFVR